MTPLFAARLYAALKLYTFPVEPREKRPVGELVPRGKDDATTHLSTLNRWFRPANGSTPNVGIACGPSQLIVIDVDLAKPKNGNTDGRIELAALVNDLGALPDTVTADTGSGGRHYLFRARAGASLVGKLGKAIDLISSSSSPSTWFPRCLPTLDRGRSRNDSAGRSGACCTAC